MSTSKSSDLKIIVHMTHTKECSSVRRDLARTSRLMSRMHTCSYCSFHALRSNDLQRGVIFTVGVNIT